MRRILLLILVLLLLGAGTFAILRQRQQQQAPLEIVRQQAVSRGKITATVNATGSIEPEALVTLTFGVAGTVRQVNVARGQLVQAGDVLATLNTDELALIVQQAEDGLQIQRLTEQQRRNYAPSPATLAAAAADIAAAEANVSIAQANLAAAQAGLQQANAQKAQLLAGATRADVAAAEAEVARADNELAQLRQSHDELLQAGIGGPPEEQLRQALEVAQKAYDAAQARLDLLKAGPRAADLQLADAAIASAQAQVQAAAGNVSAAQANLDRAKAAYDRLLEGATADELAILEAQVRSGETNLALAQLRLEQSRIVAPIAGKVASVLVQVGEQATPGAPAITIVDENAFHLEVNVDEIDIDRVALGQEVAITLDALPDLSVKGAISDIAPTPTNQGGVVVYVVTINLDQPEGVALRPGMSANASIIVQEIDDVLLVPNWAIRLDRETGKALVNVLQPGGPVVEKAIETGLRNESFSELLGGLQEGEVVAVTNERETFSLFGLGN